MQLYEFFSILKIYQVDIFNIFSPTPSPSPARRGRGVKSSSKFFGGFAAEKLT
jgi:hypothetical protein